MAEQWARVWGKGAAQTTVQWSRAGYWRLRSARGQRLGRGSRELLHFRAGLQADGALASQVVLQLFQAVLGYLQVRLETRCAGRSPQICEGPRVERHFVGGTGSEHERALEPRGRDQAFQVLDV